MFGWVVDKLLIGAALLSLAVSFGTILFSIFEVSQFVIANQASLVTAVP
uniref:Uncharacterized protein n=1 Tax=Anguilla anguilla TaxID=7936 RepID=A0A0E9QD71_ANGAN